MNPPPAPEAWLRGPLPGVDPFLMPAAHALTQCREDVAGAVAGLSTAQLWQRPGGAASLAFHLRHIAGSLDRLLTYARGEVLSDAQRAAARREKEEQGDQDARSLLDEVGSAVDAALAQLRATPRETLLEARPVGRAGTPSNVLGLLVHAAEHAQRHAGQVITTAKVLRGQAGTTPTVREQIP
jgi:uncharacterized damage-inducible protein DinB